jgi:hypothetical protein
MKALFSFILLMSTIVSAAPPETDSIIAIPEESTIIFEPRFIVRAFTDRTKIAASKDGSKVCYFFHDVAGRERFLPSELHLKITSMENAGVNGANYASSHNFVSATSTQFAKVKETLSLKCIYQYVDNSSMMTIGDFREILSGAGATLTFSDPIEY